MIQKTLTRSETAQPETSLAKPLAPTKPSHPIEAVEQKLEQNSSTLPAPLESLVQLPSDFPKTPDTTYQPDYLAFTLANDLVESLKTQAQQENVSVRSLLLAAFTALLYRYTHQEAIGLGLIIQNQDSEYATEISSLIQSELTICELAHQIAIASPYQAADQRNWRSRLPVIATFLETLSGNESGNEQILEIQQRNHECLDNLDLHLVILQQAQEITGTWTYNANLFAADTIQRLSDHWQTLLTGITTDLNCPIAQLPLLTQPEQHQLRVDWNSAATDYPQIPIYQQIEAHAAENPDQIAVEFHDQRFTYAELNQRANQLAHYLQNVGVGAEVRVAVCLQPSLEVAVSLLGVLKAGGVYTPIDPAHPFDRLTSILEDTQAKVLLTQAPLRSGLPAIAEHTLCLDQDEAVLDMLPTHNLETELSLDQTAYIIYTSGTTGKPKGVMASHRNLINYILATQERLGFNAVDVMPSIARSTFSNIDLQHFHF